MNLSHYRIIRSPYHDGFEIIYQPREATSAVDSMDDVLVSTKYISLDTVLRLVVEDAEKRKRFHKS